MAAATKKKSTKRKSALPKNAQKWVKALRSGKYKQTQNVLANEFGYCCLGVACEVAISAGVEVVKIPQMQVLDEKSRLVSMKYDGKTVALPINVQTWLGLNGDEGTFKDANGLNHLSKLNDDGLSFAEIADVIESQPFGLFTESV